LPPMVIRAFVRKFNEKSHGAKVIILLFTY